MHPCIFDDFRAMLANHFLGVDPEEISIGPAEKNYVSLWVRDHDSIVNIVENGLIETDFVAECLCFSVVHGSSPAMGYSLALIYHKKRTCQPFDPSSGRGASPGFQSEEPKGSLQDGPDGRRLRFQYRREEGI